MPINVVIAVVLFWRNGDPFKLTHPWKGGCGLFKNILMLPSSEQVVGLYSLFEVSHGHMTCFGWWHVNRSESHYQIAAALKPACDFHVFLPLWADRWGEISNSLCPRGSEMTRAPSPTISASMVEWEVHFCHVKMLRSGSYLLLKHNLAYPD